MNDSEVHLEEVKQLLPERRKRSLEGHLQTVIMVLVVALIFWVGNTLKTNNNSIIGLQRDVAYLSTTLTRLESVVTDHYSRIEANRDFTLRDKRLDRIENKLESLETQIHSKNTVYLK